MTNTKPPPKLCPDCGVEISPRKTRCIECADKHAKRLQLDYKIRERARHDKSDKR
jgi:hypothetical protein